MKLDFTKITEAAQNRQHRAHNAAKLFRAEMTIVETEAENADAIYKKKLTRRRYTEGTINTYTSFLRNL
jgi:hypothetical protein